jgi:hypothetical protein
MQLNPIAVANHQKMFSLAQQTSLPSADRVPAYCGTTGADTALPGFPVYRIRAPLCLSALHSTQ